MRPERSRTLIAFMLAVGCIGISEAAYADQFGRVLRGCVTKAYYLSHGGTLTPITPANFKKMEKANPTLFAKRGRLVVHYDGYVDAHGVTDVVATDRSNTCYPDEPRRIGNSNLVDLSPCSARFAAFDVLIGNVRYAPPKLFGKSVCVLESWDVLYDPPVKTVKS